MRTIKDSNLDLERKQRKNMGGGHLVKKSWRTPEFFFSKVVPLDLKIIRKPKDDIFNNFVVMMYYRIEKCSVSKILKSLITVISCIDMARNSFIWD